MYGNGRIVFAVTLADGRHYACAGAGSAGHRNSAASLPDTHAKFGFGNHLNKLHIDSAGEGFMLFDCGPECR